jgi:drug/metabolite transporter (DMT)-like permease
VLSVALRESKLAGVLVLVLVTLVWGTTFTVTKSSLASVGPLFFLALRFSMASLGLLVLNVGAFRSISRDEWVGGVVLGVFLMLGFVFQTVGLVQTTAAKAGFITGLAVVLVPVVGALFFGRRPFWVVYLAAFIAALGLGLLTLDFDSMGINMGDVWVFACAVSYAFYILYLGNYAGKVRILVLSLVQVYFTAICCWLLAILVEGVAVSSFTLLPLGVWFGLVYLAISATIFTTVAQTWGQRILSPERAALIFTLEPVFAAIVAYLALGERLPAMGVLGSVLIMVGMLTAEVGSWVKHVPAA